MNAVGNCITVMVLSVLKYDEIYSDCLINTVHSKGGGGGVDCLISETEIK